MSSRDSLDPLVEILEKFGSEVGTVNKMQTDSVGFKMGAAYASLHKAKQAIHQWALDIIGEDEEVPNTGWNDAKYLDRNILRAEQRAKLKGDIDDK